MPAKATKKTVAHNTAPAPSRTKAKSDTIKQTGRAGY
jgi:hypothetical protein